MKTHKQVEKHFQKKKADPIIQSQHKFKSRSQLIMEEFQQPELPDEKIYMIDKVVRMRGKQGRFGVDHSEILNFEFEMANKYRSDHMNRLVYKSENYPTLQNDPFYTGEAGVDKENRGLSSMILFQRLSKKELDDLDGKQDQQDNDSKSQFDRMSKTSKPATNRSMTNLKDPKSMTFNEWVKRKDAEKRMKQRLINDVKQEIRQELYEIAQHEQVEQEMKVKYMEDWLMQKKLSEAQKIAQLMDLQERESIQKQMRDKSNYKSYKEWLKKNMLKEKQQKYKLIQKRQELMDNEREEHMRRSIEAQIEYKQWQNEKTNQDRDAMREQRRQEEMELERRIHEQQQNLSQSNYGNGHNEDSNMSSQMYSPLRVRPNKR
ncbi:UNKNOWN [Stylonychia lemnae]|uniref:Uncharacterized protein n=1 Tax=Stylonychia lemnae TaxID=5949 RepID=A0A078B445_STYLE|nr:UNKNOWN [Stylonychia lemnae]|eukprot:CDW89305.1 UNKNOWN [Stylonychia lemnae]